VVFKLSLDVDIGFTKCARGKGRFLPTRLMVREQDPWSKVVLAWLMRRRKEGNVNSPNKQRKWFSLGSAAATLSALALGAAAAGSGWTIVSSPNATTSNYLYSVAQASASDLWSVGYAYNQTTRFDSTLTEHWNGRSWAIVPSPSPGTQRKCGSGYSGSVLTGVTAIAGSDVWATGWICSPYEGYPAQTLTEHWNGSQWTVASSPNESEADYSVLQAVAAVATNDVWAVGNYQEGGGQYQWNTLIEHWDGTQWSIVESPNVAGADENYLNAVTAASSSDVWAVGYSNINAEIDVPLIEHYDGNAWSIVSSPYPAPSEFNELYSVAAVSPSDVWAAGYENENSQGQYGGALIEHWDGSAWSLVHAPTLGFATTLYGLSARSSTDVWAVGYIWRVGTSYTPLTEHWDGTTWTDVSPPDPGKAAELFGTLASSGTVWAVGAYSTEAGDGLNNPQTLTMKR